MPTEDALNLAIPAAFFLLLAVELVRPGIRWPRVRGWRVLGMVFFVVTLAINAGTPFLVPVGWLARHRLIDGSRFGTAGGVIVGYLAFSFAGYWWHRLQHRVPFIWRWVHQLHHSAPRMDLFGALLFHPFEMLAIASINLVVTLFVLGLSPIVAAGVGTVGALYGFFQHWNVATPRWLGYLIERPEAHCLHHEKNIHARNYSDLPLWDIVFGTFANPERFAGEVGFEPAEARRILAMLAGVAVIAPVRPTGVGSRTGSRNSASGRATASA